MRVRVKLFASLREAVGQREVELECPRGARVADVVRLLAERYPGMRGLEAARVAVNLEYVGPEFGLHEGDELALIPPVSGGAATAGLAVDGPAGTANRRHGARW